MLPPPHISFEVPCVFSWNEHLSRSWVSPPTSWRGPSSTADLGHAGGRAKDLYCSPCCSRSSRRDSTQMVVDMTRFVSPNNQYLLQQVRYIFISVTGQQLKHALFTESASSTSVWCCSRMHTDLRHHRFAVLASDISERHADALVRATAFFRVKPCGQVDVWSVDVWYIFQALCD